MQLFSILEASEWEMKLLFKESGNSDMGKRTNQLCLEKRKTEKIFHVLDSVGLPKNPGEKEKQGGMWFSSGKRYCGLTFTLVQVCGADHFFGEECIINPVPERLIIVYY